MLWRQMRRKGVDTVFDSSKEWNIKASLVTSPKYMDKNANVFFGIPGQHKKQTLSIFRGSEMAIPIFLLWQVYLYSYRA